MIYYTEARIEQVSAHHIGNKSMDGELKLSDTPLKIQDDILEDLLLKYFVSHFKAPEYYCFTFADGNLDLNAVYNYASRMFENPDSFHEQSVNLAKHLFDVSEHPNIKSGDLYVAHLSKIQLDGKETQAIGIFKSEIKDAFLKLKSGNGSYQLDHDLGTSVSKLDKACLIFNSDKESGYKLCFVDKSNKAIEAKYWRDDFLNVKPAADEFNQTKSFLKMTKSFVTKEMNKGFDIDKTDQAALLNRSMDYFKTNQQFNEESFEKQVLNDQQVISAFQDYKTTFKQEKELPIAENFPISEAAVRKQSGMYRSILKLDKNFHIYIHGDKDLIERGVDEHGRKYYKVFYNEER